MVVEKIKGKKVLVIGGLGFIGSILAKKCVDQGALVTVFSRSKNKINNIQGYEDKIVVKLGLLKDIGSFVKGFDYIFNLAGSVDNYSLIEGKPYLDEEQNITSTIALLEAIKEFNSEAKLFFASTFFVNGNLKDLPANENSLCEPLGLYGATRLCGEHICKIYSRVFNIKIFIARFCNVYGPSERGLNKKKAAFNYLIRRALEKGVIDVYNGGNFIRDYIYVDDVADACITIMNKGELRKIYYVGRGEKTKFKELMEIIVKYTGAKINDIEPPEFHKRVGILDFYSDSTDLKNLGWKPKISNEEGILRVINHYKKTL